MRQIEINDLKKRSDERGWLVEVLRGDDMGEKNQFGQIFVSVAPPGKVRGNHYHNRKIEWFCVPTGTGLLLLKDPETGEELEVVMGENEPKTVKISPPIVHAIKNIGDKDMVLMVYVSESFDSSDPDTFYKKILE
jgi:UDP-2-acetamido-2,6-beta-L-arabino-hexul-4-ose reductase|tara:strand:- start:21 stop:425 length:405 start_codon:yes stop_codon:yes gene_type:complete